jgi:hypothetical protein
VFLAAAAAAVAVALANSQSDPAREFLSIVLMVVVFHGFGQWRFRKSLSACATEMERALEEKEPLPLAEPESRRRSVRNPRSTHFLSSSTPAFHLAAEATAVLLWGTLFFWDRGLEATTGFASAACVAFLAFEGVGHHQFLTRRHEEVATFLRCRRRLAKIQGT